MVETSKKLYRSNKDYVIAGVCGGLADYLGIDPIIVRLVFLALVFGGGSGVFIYIVLAIIIPQEVRVATMIDRKEKVESMAQEVKEKVKKVAKEYREDGNDRHHHNGLGWIVLLIGLYLLINQVIPGWFRADLFWPVALILAGIYLMVRK